MRKLIPLLLVLLTSWSIAQTPVATDSIYRKNIRTVQFYPNSQNENSVIHPAVVKLSSQNLVLEFDELKEEFSDFSAKIFFYNADWSSNFIADVDYLNEYNEFLLTKYDLSFNTQTDYTHYTFEIPTVNIAGNYMLYLYEGEEENVVLTRKFVVYEEKVQIARSFEFSTGSRNSPLQYLHFNIFHPDYDLEQPVSAVKVVVRKNGRWDKTISNLKPRIVKPEKLSYDMHDADETLWAGNEYRRFDIRSLRFKGFGVLNIVDSLSPTQVTLKPVKERASVPYLGLEDINGRFVTDHYEHGNGDFESDYVHTYIILKSNYTYPGTPYVFGAITDWTFQEDFKMYYDSQSKIYYCRPLLKQGYYNYEILLKGVKSGDRRQVEGNFNPTENLYEIFVYYRRPGTLDDKMIGYKAIRLNGITN